MLPSLIRLGIVTSCTDYCNFDYCRQPQMNLRLKQFLSDCYHVLHLLLTENKAVPYNLRSVSHNLTFIYLFIMKSYTKYTVK